MAVRPHHLVIVAAAVIGRGTVGLATYRYLGHHRPEACISEHQYRFEDDFIDSAEDAQCAAIAA